MVFPFSVALTLRKAQSLLTEILASNKSALCRFASLAFSFALIPYRLTTALI